MEENFTMHYSFGFGCHGRITINCMQFLPCTVSKLRKLRKLFNYEIWSEHGEIGAVRTMRQCCESLKTILVGQNQMLSQLQKDIEYLDDWEDSLKW